MRKYLFIFYLACFTLNAQQFTEVCSKNTRVYEHDGFGYLDWAEIHNSTGFILELEGYSLSDELDEPGKWVFPHITLFPEQYLLQTFDKTLENLFITNFSLPKEGGSLYLFDADGELLDALHYPELRRNNSYGLIDGKFYYFDSPTPGFPNESSKGYNGYSSAVSVNRQSGAYPPGTHIVFTAENQNEKVLFAINGQSLEDASDYTEPFVLSETMSITAIAKGDSLIASLPLYRNYFVNEKEHNLPVVHLSVDSLGLFDETYGMCMPGPGASTNKPYWGANFWMDQDIDAYFTYFDQNFVLQDAVTCDLKIHGGAGSRVRPMKSFQLRARETAESFHFNEAFFKEKKVNSFRRLVLRNSGNDFCETCLKDGALQSYFAANNLNIDLMGYAPVVVYLNGRYWGMLNLREKSDKYYIASNYGIDPNVVNLLQKDHLLALNGDNAGFVDLMYYAVAKDLNDPENFQRMEDEIDLESMVDYFCVEFYLNNRDWPNNNLKVWNAPGHKWRFLCYDLDYGLRYYWNYPELKHTVYDMLNNLPETNPYIRVLVALLENDGFKRYFINRYADLLNTIFQADAMLNALEEGKERIAGELPMHYEKWCGPFEEWEASFDLAEVFIPERVESVHEDLSRTFDKPNLAPLKIDNYPKSAGKVRLNTLVLDEFPFSGIYFETNRIDITALPNEGQLFDHWTNLRTGEVWYSKTVNVDPKQDDEFVAIYKSNESLFHLSVAPNPVGDILYLNYSMPESGVVQLDMVDFSGKKVYQMPDPQLQSIGSRTAKIDVSDLTAGTYLLYLTTDQGREAIRIYKD